MRLPLGPIIKFVFGATIFVYSHSIAVCADSSWVRNEKRDRLIIFVHGTLSDAKEAWTNVSTQEYWPSIVSQDPLFVGSDIYAFNYFAKVFQKGMTYDQIATSLWDQLALNAIHRYNQIFFVSHSMGGLVTRRLLLNHPELAHNVIGMLFLGTPSDGVSISAVSNLALKNLEFLGVSNQVLAMEAGDKLLIDMQDRFGETEFSSISTCVYETAPMPGLGIVVSRTNANDLCSRRRPVPADHSGIAKPDGKGDPAHIALFEAYRRALINSAGKRINLGFALLDSEDADGLKMALETARDVLRVIDQSTNQTWWAGALAIQGQAIFRSISSLDVEGEKQLDLAMGDLARSLPILRKHPEQPQNVIRCLRAHSTYGMALIRRAEKRADFKDASWAAQAMLHAYSHRDDLSGSEADRLSVRMGDAYFALSRAQDEGPRLETLRRAADAYEQGLSGLQKSADSAELMGVTFDLIQVLINLGFGDNQVSHLDRALQINLIAKGVTGFGDVDRTWLRYFALKAEAGVAFFRDRGELVRKRDELQSFVNNLPSEASEIAADITADSKTILDNLDSGKYVLDKAEARAHNALLCNDMICKSSKGLRHETRHHAQNL